MTTPPPPSSPLPLPAPQQQSEQLSAIQYRLSALELDIKGLQGQMLSYVPIRENDLQLQAIRSALDRIERDVNDTKRQVGELATKQVAQEIDARERASRQRESQDKLQIRVLWGIVSFAGIILSGVLVYFFTHLQLPR